MGPGLTAMIVAPMIWAAHLLGVYVLSALICERWVAAESTIPYIVVAVTLAALAGLGVLAVAARGDLARESDPDGRRRRFLAHVGLLSAGLCALGIVWNATPGLVLATCR
jgi:hypothetical protein